MKLKSHTVRKAFLHDKKNEKRLLSGASTSVMVSRTKQRSWPGVAEQGGQHGPMSLYFFGGTWPPHFYISNSA